MQVSGFAGAISWHTQHLVDPPACIGFCSRTTDSAVEQRIKRLYFYFPLIWGEIDVEQVSGGNQEAAEALVLRVAKTLQGSFAKQTNGGVSRKWRDVPLDEKKLWLRLARMAEKTFNEPGSPPAVPPAPSADVTGAKQAAPVPEATTKPTGAKKASANSAMLRLLGVKPRDDIQKK